MSKLRCTMITPGCSNPIWTTITRETTVTSSAADEIDQVTKTYEFKILLEISPNVFRVSGDHQATEYHLDALETSLAGVLLLTEYDGRYRRLWTWLWKHALSPDVFHCIHLGGDGPAALRGGRSYTLTGCDCQISMHEKVLEGKWAGRLLIQHYEQRFLIFRYIWQDIQRTLQAGWSKLFLG